jgi:hypothetical protein
LLVIAFFTFLWALTQPDECPNFDFPDSETEVELMHSWATMANTVGLVIRIQFRTSPNCWKQYVSQPSLDFPFTLEMAAVKCLPGSNVFIMEFATVL